MAQDDYAVVVGIRCYPGFGATENQAADMTSPDDDATEVRDWLVDPAGGAVPPEHVSLIRSRDFNPPFANAFVAEPQRQAITNAFDLLETTAQTNDRLRRGLAVGRRLYVFMSGHGFAPEKKKAALFTANATRVRTYHVFASAWADWFYKARYFQEVVLWMDCCMNFELSVIPEPAGYRQIVAPNLQGIRRFLAFAATFPLQAVERPMPDGRVHGVFTYTLLCGLRGDAADPDTHEVTASRLGDYLRNAMKSHLTPGDLEDSGISKEPDVEADDPISFGRVAARPQHRVTIVFPPAADGAVARVVTGRPPGEVASGVVRQAGWELALPVGVYVLKVQQPPIEKGFEVLGGREVAVDARA